MNVAINQAIILGVQIFLDHRSLGSIGRKILMILPPSKIPCCVLSYFLLVFVGQSVEQGNQLLPTPLSPSPPFRSQQLMGGRLDVFIVFVFFSFCLFVFLSKLVFNSSFLFILFHLSSLKFGWKPSESCVLSFRLSVFSSFCPDLGRLQCYMWIGMGWYGIGMGWLSSQVIGHTGCFFYCSALKND